MSSKFRFLNEQLYKTQSSEAVSLFKEPELFKDVSEIAIIKMTLLKYHEGYRI